MKLYRQVLLPLLTIAICVGAVQAGRLAQPKLEARKLDAKLIARSKGDPKSDLWIVGYTDFQCKGCREAHALLNDWMQKYPQRIYLQSRTFPLIHSHEYALKTAIYADCMAVQKHYASFIEKLFEKQDEWSVSKEPDALLERYAAEVGGDVEKLQVCVENPATKERVLKDKEEASKIGVNSTPTYFVNGKKVVGAVVLKAELEGYFK